MSRTIATNYLSGLTLTNTADNPVYVAQGVTILNTAGVGLANGAPLYWSVTNGPSAEIAGYGFGVSLNGAGSVANQGTVLAGYAGGAGYSYNTATHALTIKSAALYMRGGGVSNNQAGVIRGGLMGVGLGGAGSVINAGIIADTVAGKGFGVALAAGGSVTNMTGGSISGGLYGVLTDGIASVSNASGATISGTKRGVFMLNGSGSVSNQGGITGGTAAVELFTGGTVGNGAGGAIAGATYGIRVRNDIGTITNQGLLTGTARAGVYLGDGGIVGNLPGGSIGGGFDGVLIRGGIASVTNQGSINGSTISGVYFALGGTVSNLTGGVIKGGDAGIIIEHASGSVMNQGLIQQLIPFTTQKYAIGGILLLAGGSVNNVGGTIIGSAYGIDIAGAAGSVTNSGSIAANVSSGGAAVLLLSGGTVSNALNSTISSNGYSVLLVNGGGAVVNAGVVASYAQGGGAGIAMLAGGSVTNATGAIVTGEWIGVQFGTFAAAVTAAPGTFVNQGTVSAADGKGDGAAVWIHGPGVIINRASGVIQGSTNGTVVGGPLNGLGNGGFGIVAYYQTTVVNYGSIGGAAYAFDAAGTATSVGNRIEMAPGASFGGIVLGAHTPAQAKYSTLELMSGASVGTITGFGTKYKNFGNVTIDNGARWSFGGTVASTTTIALGANGLLSLANPSLMQGTITGSQAGDSLAVAGIAVTGLNYSGGVLTLSEASGTVSFNLPGPFSSSEFTFANDAAGALITLPPRTLTWAGSGGNTAFGTAANWNDISNGLNPAQSAPNGGDTVTFNSSNGGVTGTGTVAVLDVGSVGSGVLQLGGGATIVTGSLDAGVIASSVGQVGLTGTGTTMIVTGNAIVADDGTGVLSVLNGATFDAGSLTIGSQGNSSGALIVSGAGSVINLVGALNIGTALGVGDLTVGPGAAVHAGVVNLQGQVVLEGGLLDPTVTIINQGQTAGGNGTLQAGDIIDEGVIQAGGTKPSQRLLVVQGTVLGGGTLTINGTVQPSNPAGVLQINASGTMELTGPVLNAATTTFTDNLAQPGTYTVNNSVVDVTFADALGVLLLDDIAGFGGTITSFKGGDSFVITGGTLSNLGVSNSNTLTFSDTGVNAGGGGIDQIIFGSGVSASGFNIVNGNTVQVACFAAGTRIATVEGPIAVENLRVGDTVRTHRGDPAKIVWLGRRDVDCGHHPDPATVYPIRVAAGAFGPGAPSRELWLSPDHSVYVENVLIPIHCLINGDTIRRMEVRTVTYYHVELPAHDVILAEDLPVESYLDTGDRTNFSNSGGAVRLHPDFSARMWEMAGCAPLVLSGPLVDRVKHALVTRQAVAGVPNRVHAPWSRLNNRYTYY